MTSSAGTSKFSGEREEAYRRLEELARYEATLSSLVDSLAVVAKAAEKCKALRPEPDAAEPAADVPDGLLAAVGGEVEEPGRVRVRGPLSQEQIAALYGCTRGNISLIERRAVKKLQEAVARFPEIAVLFNEVLHSG
jgi:hypothetical protein